MRAKCPSSDRGVYHLTLRRDSQLTELHNDLKTVCIQLLSRRRLIPNSGKRRVQRLDWRTPPPRLRRINNLQSCSQQDFRNPGLVVAEALLPTAVPDAGHFLSHGFGQSRTDVSQCLDLEGAYD